MIVSWWFDTSYETINEYETRRQLVEFTLVLNKYSIVNKVFSG